MEHIESPPLTIVRPRSNDEKQDCLDGKTDTVREENDGVNCEGVNDEPLAFTLRYGLSLIRPRYGSTQPVPLPHGAEYGGYAGS